MRRLLLAALLLPLSGCASDAPPAPAAALREAAPPEEWNFTASRDVVVDGLEGQSCAAVFVVVPEGATRLAILGAAAGLTGSFPTPEGVGYVKARLFAPDGSEVPMAPRGPSAVPPHPMPYAHEATVVDPAPGEWSVRIEPNQATLHQRARVVWSEEGFGLPLTPQQQSARDAPC